MYLFTDSGGSRRVRSPVMPIGSRLLGDAAPDRVMALGNALWQDAPAGVKVAIYDPGDRELKAIGIAWARRERAIGPRASSLAPAELEFGRGVPDSGNLRQQVLRLSGALKAAVDAVPTPTGVTLLPGTGPRLIRTLALFTHGASNWIRTGGNITLKTVAAVVKAITPARTLPSSSGQCARRAGDPTTLGCAAGPAPRSKKRAANRSPCCSSGAYSGGVRECRSAA